MFVRRIAIIGSGIAGLLTAHGLRRAGHAVTLYSDRTSAQWLEESRPTGTAVRFGDATSYDRELGLAHWDDMAPRMMGGTLTICLRPRNRLLVLNGRTTAPAVAVDLRMISARWMQDLEERGGRVEIGPVSLDRLDQIAAQHDLTVVAVGRGELCQLFPRDPERSVYEVPQRNLCMVIARGDPAAFDGVSSPPAVLNAVEPAGEVFWFPYLHKDHGPTWNLLLEAKPGGPIDRFGGVRNGEEALRIACEVVSEMFPWNSAWTKGLRLADPNGWLVGSVLPSIRGPVGRLPSGRIVTGVGDTLMSLDPVAGQGANNGTRMARHLVNAVCARGDGPFDEAWMTATFERFYEDHGRHTVRFTNLFLEPVTYPMQLLLMAQYGSDGIRSDVPQRIADALLHNFEDPRQLTDSMVDPRQARQTIAENGGTWPFTVLRGALGVAREQVRQAVGLTPRHPGRQG